MLGPLIVSGGSGPVEIGARKQRALLIHLLVRVGETVPVDRLIDALWDEDPPPQARITLRSYVSSLRRVLEGAGEGQVIATRGNGYGLDVPPDSVDAVRFARLVAAAMDAAASGDPAAALQALDEGLALWRGDALADVADSPFAVGERTRLEELRLSAQEARFDALLTLGRHTEAVAGLEEFTARAALRERPHGQLMLALYRSGRAADALAVFRRYRATLADELGLDPGVELQQLADRILRQDDDLVLPPQAPARPTTPAEPSAPAPAAVPDESALVGRNHERAELEAAVQRLQHGAGGLLLVAGEAGIGKSSVLEELGRIAGTSGLQVRWGRCHETKGAPAFWPWIQILRAVVDRVDDDELNRLVAPPAAPVALLVEQIGQRVGIAAPEPDDDMEAARFRIYDGVAAFLLRASERSPLLLILDDLHWADTATLETLAFLTPLLGSSRLLVAGAYRDTGGDWGEALEATLATVVREPWTQQVGLVGLQAEAIAALAEQMTGTPLRPEDRDLLQQRTAGNPFFVRQLSRLLAESDTAPAETIPSGVRHVITRRLSVLPAHVRELLEVASVIGAQFDARLLAKVTTADMDDTLDAVSTAVQHGLIEAASRSTSVYRFVHALVRETIYDSLPPLRTARLHAHVGDALESTAQPSLDALAAHFWRAADIVDDDRPVRYLRLAAAEALAVFAHEQAESYLRQALQLLVERGGDPAAELEVRTQLMQLLTGLHGWSHPDIAEIAAPAQRSARTMSAHPDLLPLWYGLFTMFTARGESDAARDMAEQLIAEGHAASNAAVLATGLIGRAQLSVSMGGDLALSEQLARDALRVVPQGIAQHPEAGLQRIQLNAVWSLAAGLGYDGEPSAAVAAARDAIALAEEVGPPMNVVISCMVAGILGLVVGDTDVARRAADKGLPLCRRHHLRVMGAMLTLVDGCARSRTGDDAREHAPRMLAAIEEMRHGFTEVIAKALLFTAEVLALAGDDAAAAKCLQEARAHVAAHRELIYPQQLRRVEEALAGASTS